MRSLLFDEAVAQRWKDITGTNSYNSMYQDTVPLPISDEAREGAHRGGTQDDLTLPYSMHDAALNGTGQGMFHGKATQFEKNMRVPKHRSKKRERKKDDRILGCISCFTFYNYIT
jgi:hypothetical protein